MTDSQQRRDQLRQGLLAVRERIERCCRAADRDPAQLTLVVVTKTFPAQDVHLLAELGVRDVGESRDQEASAKVADCAGLDLRWHFIGRLQTNKARSVAHYADLVHSLDRRSVMAALAHGAERAGRRLDCLVQVSLDGDPARGGVPVADLPGLAAAVAEQPWLRLRGLMAVAPLGVDPEAAFAVLPELSGRVRREHPQADIVSAGMSHDLEAAVRQGATHLRVGSAILGHRAHLE